MVELSAAVGFVSIFVSIGTSQFNWFELWPGHAWVRLAGCSFSPRYFTLFSCSFFLILFTSLYICHNCDPLLLVSQYCVWLVGLQLLVCPTGAQDPWCVGLCLSIVHPMQGLDCRWSWTSVFSCLRDSWSSSSQRVISLMCLQIMDCGSSSHYLSPSLFPSFRLFRVLTSVTSISSFGQLIIPAVYQLTSSVCALKAFFFLELFGGGDLCIFIMVPGGLCNTCISAFLPLYNSYSSIQVNLTLFATI